MLGTVCVCSKLMSRSKYKLLKELLIVYYTTVNKNKTWALFTWLKVANSLSCYNSTTDTHIFVDYRKCITNAL